MSDSYSSDEDLVVSDVASLPIDEGNYYNHLNNEDIVFNISSEDHFECLLTDSENRSTIQMNSCNSGDFFDNNLQSADYAGSDIFIANDGNREAIPLSDKILNEICHSIGGEDLLEHKKCDNNDRDQRNTDSTLNFVSLDLVRNNGPQFSLNSLNLAPDSSQIRNSMAHGSEQMDSMDMDIQLNASTSLNSQSETNANCFSKSLPNVSQLLKQNIVNSDNGSNMKSYVDTGIHSSPIDETNLNEIGKLESNEALAKRQINERLNLDYTNLFNKDDNNYHPQRIKLRKNRARNSLSQQKSDDENSLINIQTDNINLLGQLLKASEHCEPSTLIPEDVVADVIPAVGYRIMDMHNLSEMIRMMHKCSSQGNIIFTQERVSLREGAASHLSVICTGCQVGAVGTTSSKQESVYDINDRIQKLKKDFNLSEIQIQKMLEILGIFYRPSVQIPNQNKPRAETENSHSKVKKNVSQYPKKSDEKTVECNICKKKFSGARYLKIHMSVHNDKRHTCPYCHAYFQRVFNLKEHVKKHENKKYICEFCFKEYSDKSTLIAHRNSIHYEMYKQECEICSKKFYHKSHYLAHLRTHTGKKPFSCDECGKQFSHLSSVKKHMLTHTRSIKYDCRLCGKSFRLMDNVRQHLLQQHKLQKVDADAHTKVVNANKSSKKNSNSDESDVFGICEEFVQRSLSNENERSPNDPQNPNLTTNNQDRFGVG